MKQVRLIFITMFLLLLITSFANALQPPNYSEPIKIEDVDSDPWDELAYNSPSPRCYGAESNGFNLSVIIDGLKIAISYFVLLDVNASSHDKFESDSKLMENGKNFNNTTESGRGLSSK